MFSSAVEQKAPLPHSSPDEGHGTSAPVHLLHPSSCWSAASGLCGGVSQDHPDSHTSGYPLLTDSNTWHRFGSAVEVPGLSLLGSLCTWNWVAWVVRPTVTVLDIGKASVEIGRVVRRRRWSCDCLSHTSNREVGRIWKKTYFKFLRFWCKSKVLPSLFIPFLDQHGALFLPSPAAVQVLAPSPASARQRVRGEYKLQNQAEDASL